MMSQNRAAQKDHIRDDHEADEVEMLYRINQQQLEILHLLRQQICPDAALSFAQDTAAQTQQDMAALATQIRSEAAQGG